MADGYGLARRPLLPRPRIPARRAFSFFQAGPLGGICSFRARSVIRCARSGVIVVYISYLQLPGG